MSALNTLRAAVNGGRFPHAVILSGGTVGVESAVLLLSQSAVCTADTKPCGVCGGCRKAAAGEHPDIDTIHPDGNEIKVGQIRAARAALQVRPNEAPRRVLVVNPADSMNIAAQNALLQTLEEPAGSVLFILAALNELSLLPTVRSRAQTYRLDPPPPPADNPTASLLLSSAAKTLRGDRSAAVDLAAACSHLAKLKGDAVAGFLEDCRAAVARHPQRFDSRALRALDRARAMYDANVTAAHISGYLLAVLTA